MFKCECGKEFEKPASFNGHKCHCKTHLKATGKYEKYLERNMTASAKTAITLKNKVELRKKEELNNWLAEKHVCQRCGKLLTEKFATGRFCSRSCANSKKCTEDKKAKVSQKLKYIWKNSVTPKTKLINKSKQRRRSIYDASPNTCKICGKIISYKNRKNLTCSTECKSKLISNNSKAAVARHGGNLNPHPNKNCKYGRYKRIECDSSWELAFLKYTLDQGINIERNHDGFKYTFENQTSTYYPDFKIDNVYYEIKNYMFDRVAAKIKCFPKDKVLKVLFYEDIKHCINYCINNYGKEFWNQLYDNRK